MTAKLNSRLLVTILACLISGAVSGFLVGPHGNQVSILVIPVFILHHSYTNPLTIPEVLQFLGPGLLFGLVSALALMFGAGETGQPFRPARAAMAVAGYTVAATLTWLLAYWIVEIGLELRLGLNFVLPGTVAGLCGGLLLAFSTQLLPNIRARTIRWTTFVGAAAGLLFFLNPGTSSLDPPSSYPPPYDQFTVLSWCISFALWQAAVGASLYLSLDAIEGSRTVPAGGHRPDGTEPPPAAERPPIAYPRGASPKAVAATVGLLAVILAAATLMSGVHLTIFDRKPMLRLTSQWTTDIVYSDDGARLVTLSSSTATIWDASTGAQEHSLNSQVIDNLAFYSGRVLTVSHDGTAIVWDVAMGSKIGTFVVPICPGYRWCVEPGKGGIGVSPDGSQLAFNVDERRIEVWHWVYRKKLVTIDLHGQQLRGIAFSPDGKRLAAADAQGVVTVWNATSGAELLTLDGQTHEASAVVFSPDGQRLATANGDQAIIWDAATGQALSHMGDAGGRISDVVFSPDGQRLATAGDNAKIWDAATGRELLNLHDGTDPIGVVAFSPDGKHLATLTSQGAAEVWDVQTWP